MARNWSNIWFAGLGQFKHVIPNHSKKSHVHTPILSVDHLSNSLKKTETSCFFFWKMETNTLKSKCQWPVTIYLPKHIENYGEMIGVHGIVDGN